MQNTPEKPDKINFALLAGRSMPTAGTMLFGNYQGHMFIEHTLSGSEFIGCLLNGASFAQTNLHNTRFTACFAPPTATRTDFGNNDLAGIAFVDSCIGSTAGSPAPGLCTWPDDLVAVAANIVSTDNGLRYRAVEELAQLGNPVVAPVLCCLLADREWDVRSVCLKTLAQLRAVNGTFPYADADIRAAMLYRLGDASPFVRATAGTLVDSLQPVDAILRSLIAQCLASPLFADRETGFRIATQLLEHDRAFEHLIDDKRIKTILSDPDINSRIEAVRFLARYDRADFLDDIVRLINDPVEQVQIEALRAVSWLSVRPDKAILVPLLAASSETVQAEAIYTLVETGYLSKQELQELWPDLSARVQQLVQPLLDTGA